MKSIFLLTLVLAEDVDAKAGWLDDLNEWWNRPDWNCKTVTCTPWLDATAPEYVGEGKGTEAHSWCCVTCSDLLS